MPGLRIIAVLQAAQRIVVQMIAVVPAAIRHVDAAAKGQAVVDDDDLLVMAGAKRVAAVKGQVDLVGRHQLDLKRGQDGVQEQADPVRKPVGGQAVPVAFAGQHLDLEIEIPADHHDHPLRLQQRLAQGAEIGLAVDDHGQPVRRFHPPTIPPRLQFDHDPTSLDTTPSRRNACKGNHVRVERVP